jgi:hypothetical protein
VSIFTPCIPSMYSFYPPFFLFYFEARLGEKEIPIQRRNTCSCRLTFGTSGLGKHSLWFGSLMGASGCHFGPNVFRLQCLPSLGLRPDSSWDFGLFLCLQQLFSIKNQDATRDVSNCALFPDKLEVYPSLPS